MKSKSKVNIKNYYNSSIFKTPKINDSKPKIISNIKQNCIKNISNIRHIYSDKKNTYNKKYLFYSLEKHFQNGRNYEGLNNYLKNNKTFKESKNNNYKNKSKEKFYTYRGKKYINNIIKNFYNHNNIIISEKIYLLNTIRAKKNYIRIQDKNLFNKNCIDYSNHMKDNNYEKKCIFSAIKNLGKYKIDKKGWTIKNRIQKSKEKNKSSIYLKKNIFDDSDESNEEMNKKQNRKSQNNSHSIIKTNFSPKENIKNKQKIKKRFNNALKKKEEDCNNIKSIVKNIFNNINNIEKKFNKIKNKSNNNDGFYSVRLIKSKNNNVIINNNINIYNYGFSNKGKFFEFQNQIK